MEGMWIVWGEKGTNMWNLTKLDIENEIFNTQYNIPNTNYEGNKKKQKKQKQTNKL